MRRQAEHVKQKKASHILCIFISLCLVLISGSIGFFAGKYARLPETISLMTYSNLQNSSALKKIDNYGLYQLSYSGDYHLDDFLQKGAKSDYELLQFAQTHLLNGQKIDLSKMKIACTSFVTKDGNGDIIYGRNMDWQSKLASVQVYTHPKNGYASVSTAPLSLPGQAASTDTAALMAKVAPYLPLDGMNEKGLTVSALYVPSSSTPHDDAKTSVGSFTIMRLLLDKTQNVDEAINLMRQYNLYFTSNVGLHYLIADATGKSVIVEYYDHDMKVVYPEEGKDYQIASNFIAYDGLNIGENNKDFEFDRYNTVQTTIEQHGGRLEEKDAVDLLAKVGIKKGDNDELQWSVIYNLSKKTGEIFAHRNTNNITTFKL